MKVIKNDPILLQPISQKWPELRLALLNLKESEMIETDLNEIFNKGWKSYDAFSMYIRTDRKLNRHFSTAKRGNKVYIYFHNETKD